MATWYYVEAGQQAGPVEEPVLEELRRTGRIQPETLVWREGMANWQPYREAKPIGSAPPAESSAPAPGAAATGGVVCCECGRAFPLDQVIRHGDRYVCATCKPVFVQRLAEGATLGSVRSGEASEEEVLARDYRIELGDCLERAWRIVTGNIGKILVSDLIYIALPLLMIAPIAGIVPVVISSGPGGNFGGVGFAIIGVLVLAFIALMLGMVVVSAGFPWFYLNLYRNGDASFDQIFDGFRGRLGSLLGAWFIQVVINIAVSLPFTILGHLFTVARPPAAVLIGGQLLLQLASFAAAIYLATIWIYTNLLIMDKRMGFWQAMQLSRRVVSKRWWMTFLFFLVAGLLASSGALVCLVGLFVTVPLFVGMKVCLYDDNFRDLAPQVH